MEYSEIIYLMRRSVESDDIGNNISSDFEIRSKCYAKKQSVRTNEFYNAAEIGLSPSVEFVIKRLNYHDEEELFWNDKRYKIIRTIDPKNKNDIVLVCERQIGINE